MAQQDAGSRIVAGAITIAGLAIVWFAVVTNLPTEQDMSAGEKAPSAAAVAAAPGAVASGRRTGNVITPGTAELTLDLTIPGVTPPVPPPPPETDRESSQGIGTSSSVPAQVDPRAAQVTRFKCEAQIEQLCPDSPEGPSRTSCLERRKADLALPCRQQLQERFVKWKEDRNRVLSACQEDVRKLCAGIRPGDGRMVQCLQAHSQDVSDRCYQTLPKGTLLFRQ
jgi:hypothetical protein